MRKLILFAFLFIFTSSLQAGVFAPFTKLYMSETKHFTLLYSDATREQASRLSSYADEMYLEIDSMLQRRTQDKITVVLTDDYEGANGYSQAVPFNHIVLYVHPADNDSTIAHNPDYLKALFYHELTHAISLSVRGPVMEVAYKIFGDWITPQHYMMPWFMIEGVTVSFESLDGFGRANNPYIGDDIRQDIAESRMKAISQASGAYDLYPGGRIFYHYGGYFSKYLQEKYGMEKYRELWQRTGGGNPLLFLPGNFRRTYDFSLRKAWKDFEEHMRIPFSLSTNTNTALKKYYAISTMDTDGRLIYFQDDFDYNIYVYNTDTKKRSLLLHTDWYIERISLSPEGNKLLISRSYVTRGNPRLVVQIYDLETGRFQPKKYQGVREAAFYQDGIIAIKPRGYFTDLVYITDTETRTLLHGDHELYFATPWAWQDEQILFNLRYQGLKKIAVYDPLTSQVSTFDTTKHLNYIRDIQVTDGKITFSHHSGQGLYSWAMISNQTLYKYTNQVLGGIHKPLSTDKGIFYKGRFSQGEKLLQWPQTWDQAEIYTLSQSILDTTNSQLSPTLSGDEKKYKALPYIRPHVWAPSIALNTALGIGEIGVTSYLSDPMRNNVIIPTITYNIDQPFANLNISWQNTAFSLPWSITAIDQIYYNTTLSNHFRQTQLAASTGYTWNLLPINRFIHMGLDISHIIFAEEQAGKNAYQWEPNFQNTILGIWARYSSLISQYPRFTSRGIQASLYYDYHIQSGLSKFEATLNATPEFLALFLNIHASYTPGSLQFMNGYHPQFGSTYAPILPEYFWFTTPDVGEIYMYGNISFPVFNVEIQKGTGAIPLYMNRIYMFSGYRAATIFDPSTTNFMDNYYHSAYAALTFDFTWGNVFDFKTRIEVIYKLNESNNPYYDPWQILYFISTDLSFLGLAQPEKKPGFKF